MFIRCWFTDKTATACNRGEDLFVTNTKFWQRGIDTATANSILVKVNQIGSLTETLDAVELAHINNYTAVLSHAPARPKTPPSLTLPWRPTAATPKLASAAATAPRNTINPPHRTGTRRQCRIRRPDLRLKSPAVSVTLAAFYAHRTQRNTSGASSNA